ncbi:MAG: flagellar basal body rod protein FlgC [Deltaproteobacteria bacterium]|nr:flagellar basal body rod protein FlgC [Deltaproteobacteria bacterium]
MDFFTAMEVSASGLAAERTRMNVASSNLANVQTTETPEGGPYKKRDVMLSSKVVPGQKVAGGTAGGFAEAVRAVDVQAIVEDATPPRLEYDPDHPSADADGYVAYPNVNIVEEMVDMITASRAYEAGVTALDTAVSMAERALSIGGR